MSLSCVVRKALSSELQLECWWHVVFDPPVQAPQGALGNLTTLCEPPPQLAFREQMADPMLCKAWPQQALLGKGVLRIPGSRHVPGCKGWYVLLTYYDTHLLHILRVQGRGLFLFMAGSGDGFSQGGYPSPTCCSPAPGVHAQGPGGQVQAARSAGGAHATGAEVPPAAQGEAISPLAAPCVTRALVAGALAHGPGGTKADE